MLSQKYFIHIPASIPDWCVDADTADFGEGRYGCDIIGFSSYPGETIVATIKLRESKSIFYGIPLHALQRTGIRKSLLEVCPRNCPSSDVTIFRHSESRVTLFNEDGMVDVGDYIMSVDWHTENWLCHIVASSNSLYCWPNPRCLWGNDVPTTLPEGFRKIRKAWTV